MAPDLSELCQMTPFARTRRSRRDGFVRHQRGRGAPLRRRPQATPPGTPTRPPFPRRDRRTSRRRAPPRRHVELADRGAHASSTVPPPAFGAAGNWSPRRPPPRETRRRSGTTRTRTRCPWTPRARPTRWRARWKFVRLHTIRGTIRTTAIGDQAGRRNNPELFNASLVPRAALGLVALLCGNGYIVGINQIYDVDIDKVNKPFLPVAAGELTVPLAWACGPSPRSAAPSCSPTSGPCHLQAVLRRACRRG